MHAPIFVFLHVGVDTALPQLLTASIRRLQPGACVIQCSDDETPQIEAVTRVHRVQGDVSRLMTFRLGAFASLQLTEPAIYLDTDMLCVASVDPVQALGAHDVAVCRREFDRDLLFNTAFRGMDLRQYQGWTLDAVYPYLACATVTRNAEFWASCLRELESMVDQFHRWYGDQEAIRAVVEHGAYRVGHLPEGRFARLPDRPVTAEVDPLLLHFKGAARKAMMLTCARQLQIAA
jgi:hypothetical protein